MKKLFNKKKVLRRHLKIAQEFLKLIFWKHISIWKILNCKNWNFKIAFGTIKTKDSFISFNRFCCHCVPWSRCSHEWNSKWGWTRTWGHCCFSVWSRLWASRRGKNNLHSGRKSILLAAQPTSLYRYELKNNYKNFIQV